MLPANIDRSMMENENRSLRARLEVLQAAKDALQVQYDMLTSPTALDEFEEEPEEVDTNPVDDGIGENLRQQKQLELDHGLDYSALAGEVSKAREKAKENEKVVGELRKENGQQRIDLEFKQHQLDNQQQQLDGQQRRLGEMGTLKTELRKARNDLNVVWGG